MGGGGGCYHIGGTGADGGGAYHHAAAFHGLGISDGGMGHGLLIMRAVGGKRVARGIKRFAQACHIAMAENGPDTGKEWHLLAVDAGGLRLKIAHNGLRHGEADGVLAHAVLPAAARALVQAWVRRAKVCSM